MKNLFLFAVLAVVFIACDARSAINLDSIARQERVVIDVSRFQGQIDFGKVTESPLKWIYIKATEGMNTDPMFLTNVQGAKAAGMHVGCYCFFSEKSSASAQATHFLNTVKSAGVQCDLIPMVDVETLKSYTPEQLVDSLQVLVDILEAEYHAKPLIYSGENFFLKNLKAFAGYPLWIAKYSDKAPNIDGLDYILWQASEMGVIDGIDGYVDVNRFVKEHRPRDIKLPSSKSDGKKKDSGPKKTKKNGKRKRNKKEKTE